MLQEKIRIEKLKVKEGALDAEQRLFLQDSDISFKPDILDVISCECWAEIEIIEIPTCSGAYSF
jgi:hypothetical protein